MKSILTKYVNKFNNDDNECYKQDIDNASAEKWLQENIPLISIPDKTIEEIYYFRWWIFRKHIKNTEDGYVITEFLPSVLWGGKHNTIIAAAGHHVSEAKWLKNNREIIESYMKLWLEEKSETYMYSSWLIYSIFEYCTHINDYSFGIENIDLLINYYQKTEIKHRTDSGLFWSIDGNDAMECSISGTTPDLDRQKGIRPTLNSYMAANAYAISEFAAKAKKAELSKEYYQKYEIIKKKINELLWDGEFYRAMHFEGIELSEQPDINDIPESQNVKELIGYIPWCFNIAPDGFENAFELLKDGKAFKCEYGLTTAEQCHPRYLYEVDHECLWNGYIWPFATTQVLNAVINLLDNYTQEIIDKVDFYDILKTYSLMHYFDEEGKESQCWLDEVKHPITNKWSSRKMLEAWGWEESRGGFERGKDYNHSGFCDIVLRGLLGVRVKDGKISVSPKIPDEWEYFKVENLWVNDNCYSIVFDKTGKQPDGKVGVQVIKNN